MKHLSVFQKRDPGRDSWMGQFSDLEVETNLQNLIHINRINSPSFSYDKFNDIQDQLAKISKKSSSIVN